MNSGEPVIVRFHRQLRFAPGFDSRLGGDA